MGVRAVGVHTSQDTEGLPARCADESLLIGATPTSYDDAAKLVEAARQGRASGVHPGARVVPGLRQAVLAAGLQWLGDPVVLPVSWSGSVAATGSPLPFPALPPRAVEVVGGLDALAVALGEPAGTARGGCAVQVEVTAGPGAVTALDLLGTEDLWWDLAAEPGTEADGPLLAVLTAWAVDEPAAWDLAAQAAARSVVQGPVVDLPDLVRRARP